MYDILEEAQAVLQCKTCAWYKNCVTPMRLTPEDMQRQLKSMMGYPGAPDASSPDMRNFLESTASALQNVILEGCPVFISRLKANAKLAQRLKQTMQTWGMENEPTERK